MFHARAVDVVGVDPNVADIHAQPELDLTPRSGVGEHRLDSVLHRERGFDLALSTVGRFCEKAVAGQPLDDSAASPRDRGIDHCGARAAPSLDDSDLV